MPGIEITVTNQTRTRVDAAWLRRMLRKVFALLKIRDGVWTITIVEDAEMAKLHQRTMRLGTTTDVLTFDLRESGVGSRNSEVELDTVICADEAARRAGELGHAVRNEVLLYAIHSLLHVRGYDDLTELDAAAMHQREDELLVALGVGVVYGRQVRKAGHR